MKWFYVVFALYVAFAVSENPDGKTSFIYSFFKIYIYIYIYKNVVFPAQAEYSYFFAHFRLQILFLDYMAYDISVL